MEDKQVIWYHGTHEANVASIRATGFREGTWFARHMEDAAEFGGPYVFMVRVKFDKPLDCWQVCCSNTIPAENIRGMVQVTVVFKDKERIIAEFLAEYPLLPPPNRL